MVKLTCIVIMWELPSQATLCAMVIEMEESPSACLKAKKRTKLLGKGSWYSMTKVPQSVFSVIALLFNTHTKNNCIECI